MLGDIWYYDISYIFHESNLKKNYFAYFLQKNLKKFLQHWNLTILRPFVRKFKESCVITHPGVPVLCAALI